MKVGLVAPKNTPAEQEWVCSLFPFAMEPRRHGVLYDVVLFLNLTEEARRIRRRADTRICTVNEEPRGKWPPNYDPDLLDLCEFYMGYRNFAGPGFRGVFETFHFYADREESLRTRFRTHIDAPRTHDFILFARHDPNHRRAIAARLAAHDALLLGPLFGKTVADKLEGQRHCRFEWITENEINDYYFSEKVPQALAAGCVPVYFGCTRARDHVDPDLFVDVHEFGDPADPAVIDRVIAHCLAPGVYEKTHAAIRARAEALLTSRFSIEGALVRPVAERIERWSTEGFRANRKPWWRWW